MPEMDGFALARQIRAGEAAVSQQRRLAIIAATADVAPTILQRCTAAGMDGYLAKPLEIDRLEALLRRHLPAAFDLRRPRRDAECVRREYHHEIDGERFPFDLPDVGDARRDISTEHVDRHRVSELPAERSEGD